MAKMALERIRVLDLGVVWALPHAGVLFGNMGAEVLKLESIQYFDSTRSLINPPRGPGLFLGYPDRDPGEHPWNRAAYFNGTNQSKYGFTLDLSRERGKELFKRLVKVCDVVIENFSYGVMDRMGLGYEVLKGVNPGIIMVSAPGYGNVGPYRSYLAYGGNQWHLMGLANITGYPDSGPMQAAINYGDPTAGTHVVGCVLAALLYRKRTGEGQFIDVSQTDPGICCLGEFILDYTMNGRLPGPMANRHRFLAPQGVYRCRGDDMWVALTVSSEEEWQALCRVMGDPSWTQEPRFADMEGRRRNHDDLDKLIEEWTSQHDRLEAMHLMQKAGVAAGAVLRTCDVFDDPQHKARGFHEIVTHPEAGTHPYANVAWRHLSKTPGRIRWASPTLGQHNDYVFGELLGMSRNQMAELERQQFIGTIPLPGADGMPIPAKRIPTATPAEGTGASDQASPRVV